MNVLNKTNCLLEYERQKKNLFPKLKRREKQLQLSLILLRENYNFQSLKNTNFIFSKLFSVDNCTMSYLAK